MNNAIPRKILCPQCFSELILEELPSGEIGTRCPKCGPLGKAKPPEEKDRKAFWKRCPTLMSDDPFADCPFPS